jgi:cyclopropane fatty-acyl-phospholipid synthase-like methyltransferase
LIDARRIRAFYAAVGPFYDGYGGRARAWHWGIWERGVRTRHQALMRSNLILVRGVKLTSRSRILDVGCGSGGFAVWAAKKFGCRVTGITIRPEHARLAGRYARERGVGHLCKFVPMNMDRLRLPPAEFDLVVNQESFSHSLDKARYLASLGNVVAPGGAWRCIDTCIPSEEHPSADCRRVLKTVYEGFRVPNLPTLDQVHRYLAKAGFIDIESVDLSRRVLPNRRYMEPRSFALAALFPQWSVPGGRAARAVGSDNYRAAFAYMSGLERRYVTHVLHHARRPLGEVALVTA